MSNDEVPILGYHVKGLGLAHTYNNQHTEFFNRVMVSTFNIRQSPPFFEYDSLYPARAGKVDGNLVKYWLARVQNEQDAAYGWLFRWEGSRQRQKIEIVSRKPLPESFRSGQLSVHVMRRWTASEIDTWAKDQYWFQTFPWSPARKDGQRKADSQLVWDVIQHETSWVNCAVLDVGTHYGYHALKAAAAGADVVGFEPEEPSRTNAILIDQHIEQQGIEYVDKDPGGNFDTILYLSVHHQIDPTYDQLANAIMQYRARCRHLFVELILPSSYPEFGARRSDEDVDGMVGGKVLLTYAHAVRGSRRIYHVPGDL